MKANVSNKKAICVFSTSLLDKCVC